MTSLESWKPIEEATWKALPGMGLNWMGKSDASDGGYMIMMTNGCGLWGENRTAKYISDKAEVWAPCIEAGIKEISELVLGDLAKLNVKAEWSVDRQNVVLHITSRLNDLSYRWEFECSRLSDELFSHHWATPMLVQVQHLHLKVMQLQKEVEQKRRQLEELLPDDKTSKNSAKPTKTKDSIIESAVEAAVVKGAWMVLQDHLTHYPQIMKHLSVTSNSCGNDVDPKSRNKLAASPNKKLQDIKRPVEEEDEAEVEAREAEEQRKRREKIQEITHGTAIPATQAKKKKKKLNI